MVVAQAQKIEVTADRVTFTFSPAQKTHASTLEQHRAWLENVAQQIAGRRIVIAGVMGEATAATVPPPSKSQAGAETGPGGNGAAAPATKPGPDPAQKATLREQAMADASVQALLEVFPAEIRDVEEM